MLLQFALLAAGEEDDRFDRQLGPIHLIKYVYLADLHYSQSHQGKTFTGVDWRFYHFGAWSETVHSRIEPALKAIKASQYKFESDFGKDDWVRWEAQDGKRLQDLSEKLPLAITGKLKRQVHQYTKNTTELLHLTYGTPPLLNAAPNEYLDFSVEDVDAQAGESDLRISSLSNKKTKTFKKNMQELRSLYQKKHSQRKRKKLVNPAPNSRQDDVLEKGIRWLESLSGEEFSEEKIVAEFDEDVWKSLTRKGHDVSG